MRAATLAPEDFELVFNAANALRQAGRDLEAEDYYRKAARVSPQVHVGFICKKCNIASR